MLIEKLKTIVGPKAWTTDASEMAPRLVDWRRTVQGAAQMVVFPATTAEVSDVVRACHDANVAIIPQGGNTGMCAGAVPDDSGEQIVICLGRMNSIRQVDAANYSMEVEAGCILENVQRAASQVRRLFALSLGAEGSCQIGGNLATNAGGINVIRYGTARAQVLGLEAVLADGTIVSSLRSLRKDTAGYDLKQLFVGSEGTLGIITAATLKLHPEPGHKSTAIVGLRTSGDAVRLLSHMQSAHGDAIDAFELISDYVFSLVLKHIPNVVAPFSEDYPWYVLVETSGPSTANEIEHSLQDALADDLIVDAVVAKNSTEAQAFWRLRHSIAEAERSEGQALKHDIAVPISRIEEFLQRGDALLQELAPDAQLVAFGHVGDGNLHYNVALSRGFENGAAITAAIYALATDIGGTFSAEHGIGSLKRAYLPKYRSRTEVELMRTLKKALDPTNILNPGKII